MVVVGVIVLVLAVGEGEYEGAVGVPGVTVM